MCSKTTLQCGPRYGKGEWLGDLCQKGSCDLNYNNNL